MAQIIRIGAGIAEGVNAAFGGWRAGQKHAQALKMNQQKMDIAEAGAGLAERQVGLAESAGVREQEAHDLAKRNFESAEIHAESTVASWEPQDAAWGSGQLQQGQDAVIRLRREIEQGSSEGLDMGPQIMAAQSLITQLEALRAGESGQNRLSTLQQRFQSMVDELGLELTEDEEDALTAVFSGYGPDSKRTGRSGTSSSSSAGDGPKAVVVLTNSINSAELTLKDKMEREPLDNALNDITEQFLLYKPPPGDEASAEAYADAFILLQGARKALTPGAPGGLKAAGRKIDEARLAAMVAMEPGLAAAKKESRHIQGQLETKLESHYSDMRWFQSVMSLQKQTDEWGDPKLLAGDSEVMSWMADTARALNVDRHPGDQMLKSRDSTEHLIGRAAIAASMGMLRKESPNLTDSMALKIIHNRQVEGGNIRQSTREKLREMVTSDPDYAGTVITDLIAMKQGFSDQFGGQWTGDGAVGEMLGWEAPIVDEMSDPHGTMEWLQDMVHGRKRGSTYKGRELWWTSGDGWDNHETRAVAAAIVQAARASNLPVADFAMRSYGELAMLAAGKDPKAAQYRQVLESMLKWKLSEPDPSMLAGVKKKVGAIAEAFEDAPLFGLGAPGAVVEGVLDAHELRNQTIEAINANNFVPEELKKRKVAKADFISKYGTPTTGITKKYRAGGRGISNPFASDNQESDPFMQMLSLNFSVGESIDRQQLLENVINTYTAYERSGVKWPDMPDHLKDQVRMFYSNFDGQYAEQIDKKARAYTKKMRAGAKSRKTVVEKLRAQRELRSFQAEQEQLMLKDATRGRRLDEDALKRAGELEELQERQLIFDRKTGAIEEEYRDNRG